MPALETDARSTLPKCLVYGNCQAPALAEVLGDSPAFAAEYDVAHIPAVHTITPAQRSQLDELIAQAALIIAQPIRRGYREMKLGTEEAFAAAPSDCRIIRWPVLFYQPLFPYQALLTLEGKRVFAPITREFHDLRVVTCAHRGMGLDAGLDWLESYAPDEATLREIVTTVGAGLREREREVDIAVFDRVAASADSHRTSFFTVNHPSRLTLRYVSESVHRELGLPYEDAGTSEPLDWIRTPVEEPVANVLGLPGDGAPEWIIRGQPVSRATVSGAQLEFYLERPDVVAAAIERHEARLARLGLIQPDGALPDVPEEEEGSYD